MEPTRNVQMLVTEGRVITSESYQKNFTAYHSAMKTIYLLYIKETVLRKSEDQQKVSLV